MKKENEEEKSLKWKLKESPTIESLKMAIDAGILSKEEAHSIAVQDFEKDEQLKALQEQVEFLKDIIDRLSKNQSYGVVWNYVQTYTPRQNWYTTTYPNSMMLCNAISGSSVSSTGSANLVGAGSGNIVS